LGVNLNVLHRFRKNTQISNFVTICPVRAKLFHADGLTNRNTNMMKLTEAFCNFAKMPPKNETPYDNNEMTEDKETDAMQGM